MSSRFCILVRGGDMLGRVDEEEIEQSEKGFPNSVSDFKE